MTLNAVVCKDMNLLRQSEQVALDRGQRKKKKIRQPTLIDWDIRLGLIWFKGDDK